MYHRLSSLLAFCLLFALSANSLAKDDFLLVDEAFKPEIKSIDADGVHLEWRIADGYYLYKSKFRFNSKTPGVDLGEPRMPPAEPKNDPFFGKLEVYHHKADIVVPVADGASGSIEIEAVYQGCADAGLCYPPQHRDFKVELPQAGASKIAALTPAASALPGKSGDSPLGGLSALGDSMGLGEDDILPVEKAYVFDAEVKDGRTLHLHWDIADGTYLYQDQIKFDLAAAGVRVGAYRLPKPEIKKDSILPNGEIGDVAVYHNSLDIDVPLRRGATAEIPAELKVSYQGCAERGICYPPQRQTLQLLLPAVAQADDLNAEPPASAPPAAPLPAQTEVSEQDRITALLGGGNPWLILLSFFGFGLLLSLTPCVFPMIPILSGIIAGHGTAITVRKGLILSLVYVVAMALTYAIAGVIAGLFGANLQAAFQNPWILSVFVLVFVLLALSMFGFYELQLPSSLQSRLTALSNKQQGGHLAGVAIMGVLSALIVGPCVAPPLAGALIYIGQSQDPLLGGLALFMMGLGMGAPLILLGTSAGKLLPKAGPWMDSIKAFFGVTLLGVAIVLLERIVSPTIAMALWGLLLVASSVYMGALDPLPADGGGWRKLWKGLGFALLVYGVLMLVGVAVGGKDTVQPLRGIGFGGGAAGPSAMHLKMDTIKSSADLERAIAEANARGKPVMLDFYADWCVSCKEMERYTFSDPKVVQALSHFVVLQADVTANDDIDKALMQRFGIQGPPAILFFGLDGAERKGLRVVGFMDADEFSGQVRKVR